MILSPLSVEKLYSPASLVPPPYHLISCAPTKSNLYFDSSFATATSEPAHKQTSHIPCTKSYVNFPELKSFMQGIRPISMLFQTLQSAQL
jgi:hypothetical protein